ncbi:MAG TPA: hypothetical protein VLJ21_03945 [Candidatus Binatia bacterium]|nr:hypothetical protein [Candidatus Binatia bacterium]
MGDLEKSVFSLRANPRLGLDADGGDDTNQGTVGQRAYEGLARFIEEFPNVTVKVVAQPELLGEFVLKFCALPRVNFESSGGRIESDGRVTGERRKTATYKLLTDLSEGTLDGVLTCASNRGVVPIAHHVLDSIPGVTSIPILAELPSMRGSYFGLDVGATVDGTGEQLAQFAKMGAAYVRAVKNKKYPTIALLANSTDIGRTNQATREAHNILQGLRDVEYLGPLTALHFMDGRYGGKDIDLSVQDGFDGNLSIKGISAGARHMKEGLEAKLKGKSLFGKLFSLSLANATLDYLRTEYERIATHRLINHRSSDETIHAQIAQLPSRTGSYFCLDVGGTADYTPQELSRVARIGVEYAVKEWGKSPQDVTVGFLSNGEEFTKGNTLVRETMKLLAHENGIPMPRHVEPKHCLDGDVNVVIAPGSTGGIFKDSYIAGARLVCATVAKGLENAKLGIFGPSFKRTLRAIAAPVSKSVYNGAAALGLCVRNERVVSSDLPLAVDYSGVLFKGHGDSDADGYYYALKRMLHYVNADTTNRIARELNQ